MKNYKLLTLSFKELETIRESLIQLANAFELVGRKSEAKKLRELADDSRLSASYGIKVSDIVE